MGTKLVTVATFDQVVQAQMAADALRAGGIDAVVTDAEVVSMDWLLGQAVGGIKVQVRDEDADRAVEELNRTFGDNGEGFGTTPPAPEATDSVPDAETGGDPIAPVPDFRLAPEDQIPPPPDPCSRDGYARRIVLTAWLGILFPPAWFVALYFLMNVLFGDGELSPRGRFNLILAAVVMAVGLPMAYLFFLTLSFAL
jgi:hypothetical protein